MYRQNLTCYICILAASTLLAAGPAKADDANADAKKAIRTVLDDQVTAWNRRDLEGFMGGYWKSPKLTFSSGNSKVEGWQGTFDRYKLRYQSEGREMGKLAFSELEIEQLGPDSAFVRGRFRLEMGKESPTGLFTLIFRKMPEGWRIVHDHTSTEATPLKKPQ
jgi:beta-aspartyl-peptidase (threonine type)